MCLCGVKLLHSSYTHICPECGSEGTFINPQIQTFNATPQSCLIVAPYSRKTRFVTLLKKILGVDTGPNYQDMIWKHLSKSAPFLNTKDIINCLKHSNLKSKHYTSLHVFAKAFMTDYVPPKCCLSPLKIEKLLSTIFSEVLFRWRGGSNNSFFSYAWLLEIMFKQIGIFDVYKYYLKILVCPNRRDNYTKRWITMFPQTDSLPYQNDTQRGLQEIV
jgi:hypothetical protein